MAEFLWTFAIQEVLKKAVKVVGEQIGLAWGLEKDLSELKTWLLKAEATLQDINTRMLHHNSVRIWVDHLHHLVYQVDDLLDEIVYEHLRQKVKTKKMNKVRDFVSPSTNVFIFRRNMAKKMKNVVNLLEKHYGGTSHLGLVNNGSVEPEIDVISQLRETISELDDHNIMGRDVEVESIVKQVIDASNQQLTSILPIVGMGGLGKTTLAKLVFNHEMIKQHFDKTIWVCVSEPFIINTILEAILQNLEGISNGRDNKEVLLHKLQKKLHGKRYFLVLDDVWNDIPHLWDDLKCCLMRLTGKTENSILVTTRSVDVANIMETLPTHHLCKLSDDQCWSLLKESANAYEPSKISCLEEVREQLVKKIGGIPLVARVLGSAVKFERNNDERWVTMLKNVVSIPQREENFVLSILKLSVDRLPSSSLKQCFAFCSNFPKDYEFKKEELVQMWMAQGFIQPQEEGSNITMENVGNMYFNILLSRCLFQDVFKDDEGRIIGGKMHDIIHDVACNVSKDQKLQLDSSDLLDEELWINKSKGVASQLRTIIVDNTTFPKRIKKVFCGKIVINSVCLRVLKINHSTEKLLNSIGRLKHLRYLNISSISRRKLPSSIVLLYNLQTLRLEDSYIKYFPKNFTDLISLRHLTFGIGVIKMPPHLSKLNQLQTLSCFTVGFKKSCKISELGPLKNLQGSLRLFCLEKVESKEEARVANLVDKEKLDVLELNWSEDRKENNDNDLEVLNGLQPHRNLKTLNVRNSGSKCLPDKIFVENLREIRLYGCKNCEKLPMLGQLNNLKELRIFFFQGVRSIGKEFYGNDSNQRTFFPKLAIFILGGMINLEQWEEITIEDASSSNVITFPYLKELEIDRCPKLLNIPDVFGGCDENDVQHLESVTISKCQLRKLPNGIQFCHSIQFLKLDRVSDLNLNLQNKHKLRGLSINRLDKLPQGLCHLINLTRLTIEGCLQNYDFSPFMHLSSLTGFNFIEDELSSITQLPQQLQHLTALQDLYLGNFNGIEALPEWFKNFVSLQALTLNHFPNLKQLPSKEAMLHLTKLSIMDVSRCPKLQLGEGDIERAKLSHIPNLYFYD